MEKNNIYNIIKEEFINLSVLINKENNKYSLEIDNFISNNQSNLLNLEKLPSDYKDKIIKELFDNLAKLILNNFSSPRLSFIINYISLILTKLNYNKTLNDEEIYSTLLLECITLENNNNHDSLYNNYEFNNQNKEISSSNIMSEHSFISNQFLYAFYALITTLSNKLNVLVKSKNLLKSIITVISQLCEIDNTVIFYKKKRLISVFDKIIKDLSNHINLNYVDYNNTTKNSKENTKDLSNYKDTLNIFNEISVLFVNIFAKIGKKRIIYRDYMFKKSIPDLITNVYTKYFNKDDEFSKFFCIYILFSIRIPDHKLFFWSKGIINIFMENIKCILIDSYKNKDLILETYLITIFSLTKDCENTQSELIELNILDISKQIMIEYSKNTSILLGVILILRRIKNKSFLNQLTQELLYTLIALIEFYYVSIKESQIKLKTDETDISLKISNLDINGNSKLLKNINAPSNNTLPNKEMNKELILIKEVLALLGNMVAIQIDCKIFYQKNLHIIATDIVSTFIEYPKLVKTCLGVFINLINDKTIRDNISKVGAFNKLIYSTLDYYKNNYYIIDYLLKMISNLIYNVDALNAFLAGDIIYYLLLFLKNFPDYEGIMQDNIKIINEIVNNKLGYDEFNEKLKVFYSTMLSEDEFKKLEKITDYTNDSKYFIAFFEDLLYIVEINTDNINISINCLLILAFVTKKQNIHLYKNIEFNNKLNSILKKLIETYNYDNNSKKLISQCIAQLPIEELK